MNNQTLYSLINHCDRDKVALECRETGCRVRKRSARTIQFPISNNPQPTAKSDNISEGKYPTLV